MVDDLLLWPLRVKGSQRTVEIWSTGENGNYVTKVGVSSQNVREIFEDESPWLIRNHPVSDPPRLERDNHNQNRDTHYAESPLFQDL